MHDNSAYPAETRKRVIAAFDAFQEGRFKDVVRLMEGLTTPDETGAAELSYIFAESLLQVGRSRDALVAISNGLDTPGRQAMDAEYRQLIGRIHLTNEEPQEASDWFEMAIDLAPDDPDNWTGLAIASAALGDMNKRLVCSQNALACDRTSPTLWKNLGNARRDLGRNDEAIEAYRTAVKLAPDRWDIHAELGAVLARTPAADEGIELLVDAIAARPGDFHIQELHLLACLNANRPTAAARAYRRLQTLDPIGSQSTITFLARNLNIDPADVHESLMAATLKMERRPS